MVRQHLDSIREKELDAARRVKEARAEGAALIEKAHEEGALLLEEKKIEGVELTKSRVKDARDKAEAQTDRLRSGNKERMEALEAAASGRRRDAVDAILEAFRKGLPGRG